MRFARDIMFYKIIEVHLIMSNEAAFTVSVYRAEWKESVPRGGLYGMPFPVLRNNIRRIVARLRRAIDIKCEKAEAFCPYFVFMIADFRRLFFCY
jgi:hypothetical protein